MEDEVKKLGFYIEQMVNAAGRQKKDIAAEAGLTAQQLSALFNAANTTYSTLTKLCKACGVNPWQFIASVESGIPIKMFVIIDELFKLPAEKQMLVLQQMKVAIALVLGKNLEEK